jgi:hypothetical protein
VSRNNESTRRSERHDKGQRSRTFSCHRRDPCPRDNCRLLHHGGIGRSCEIYMAVNQAISKMETL